MTKPLISIDWDHTFRNMHGLDLNILALIAYANAKKIPVGLTTHRDKENTTLYSLCHWHSKTDLEKNSLAAAIHHWQTNFFSKLNIKFDFINARYQPVSANNYYEVALLPHEKMLAHQIKDCNLLQKPEAIKNMIFEYQKPEDVIVNNEFKGAQLNWLATSYADSFNGNIYHIDDSYEVCQGAQSELLKSNSQSNVTINPIYYERGPLLCNESCNKLLIDIGLITEWEAFLQNDCEFQHDNEALFLSLCLLAIQIGYDEPSLLARIAEKLSEVDSLLQNQGLKNLITQLIAKITQHNQPIHFFLNEWVEV